MNAPKVVAGLAVLVLAGFWAVVMITFLQTIGYIILIIAPFILLLAIGFYAVIDGFGVGPIAPRGGSAKSGPKIGALSVAVLKMTAEGKTPQEIAAATSVSLSEVNKKIERLTKLGFLSEQALSEKGFNALKETE